MEEMFSSHGFVFYFDYKTTSMIESYLKNRIFRFFCGIQIKNLFYPSSLAYNSRRMLCAVFVSGRRMTG